MRKLRYSVLAALVFCAAAAWSLDPHQSLRRFGYQSWQTDSGLPQNTVHAVLQTRDGFLWIATEAGLARFDSVNFAVFIHKTTPQLPSDIVYALLQDRSGTLWIGTANGVARYSAGAFQDFPETSGSAAWSLFQDSQGRIWVATSAGLLRLDGARFVAVPGVPLLDEHSRLAESTDGSLWLATTEGLFHAAPGNATYFTLAGRPAQITALAADSQGHVWAGTEDGVELCATACRDLAPFAGKSVRAIVPVSGGIWAGGDAGLWFYNPAQPRALLAVTQKSGLPPMRVNLLFRDREGALWIGVANGLVRLFDGKIQPREGFSGGNVLSIAEDCEGNLWYGTESGGLAILRDRTFTTYTAQDGISDDRILAITQDRSGAVWVGTNGGGLDHAQPGSIDAKGFSAITTANGLSSNIILSLAAAPNGDLWIGTPDGLDRMRGGEIKAFTSADGLSDDFVRSLHFDAQGTLWIGTRHGLSQYRNGEFTSWTALDGLGSDLVGAIAQAPGDGSPGDNLWIGTLGGLTRMQHGRFHNYTQRDGLSNNIVTALHPDSDGTLWIGTDGGGLTRWRNGVLKSVSVKSSPLPADIYSILADDEGNLWLGANDGIYRVSRSALNRFLDGSLASLPVARYGIADGMRIGETSSGGHPAAWRLANGELWFATLKGVATVDPARLDANRIPPPISIERFSVDDRPLMPASGSTPLKIPAGSRRFAFDYAALSFSAPSKVRFRYKLDGFDHHWIDAGAQRSAYYTNLPPGRYTFRVMGCNNDGVWSAAPATLVFQLRPYFYQTFWFYLLLALAIALLGYAAYLWRVRQVESRYKAVLSERNRIAREIHDTLAQGFVAVAVQLQIVGRALSGSSDAATRHLDEAQQLVRTGLEDARRAIWELRSENSDTQDLVSQLKQMAQRVTAQSGIRTHVEAHGTYRPLPGRTETELLRIAQEAVTNVVRHAHATSIEMQLYFSRRRVKLTIADNGQGFAGEALSVADGHFGITGMRERAQQMGGSVTVSSRRGQGTEVHVEAPAGSESR